MGLLSPKALVKVKNLGIKIPETTSGGLELLSGISHDFLSGKISVFVGSETDEKSSFLRAIGGSLRKYTGSIEVNGVDIRNNPESLITSLFLISESISYEFPSTLKELPKTLKKHFENWDISVYSQFLNHFGISSDTRFSQLNDRQKKQVLCSISLASHVPVLIYENVESFLDPKVEALFYDYLRIRSQMGASIIMSSCRVSTWKNHASYDLYRIKEGRLYRIDQEKLNYKAWVKQKERAANGFGHFDDTQNTWSITMTSLSNDR